MCIRQIDLNARLGCVRRKRITIDSQFRRVFAIAITKTRKKQNHNTQQQGDEKKTLLARSQIAALASNEHFPAYTTRITRSDYRSRFRRILVHCAYRSYFSSLCTVCTACSTWQVI